MHGSNSYAALEDVARRETEAVLRSHYERCLAGRAANDRAPTPYNWPGVFEHYIEFFELGALWERTRRERGVPRRYSVCDFGPPRLSRYSPVEDDEPGSSVRATLRHAFGSLRRAHARGWRNVPRVVGNAVRLWLRAGSR
jgi:hypothetical protein